MSQQVKVYRKLSLEAPYGRMDTGTSEATAIDGGTTADVSFINIHCKSTATSGCTRAIKSTLYANGAGMEGEAVRARTIVNAAVAGGVHGVHGGVDMGTSGEIDGLAVGVRGTFHEAANVAHTAGSVYGGMSELYAGGTNTDFGAFTNHAIHRFVIDGNATGKNTVDYVFEFALTNTGCGVWTNGVTNTNMLASLTQALKCKINGTTYYLPLASAIT